MSPAVSARGLSKLFRRRMPRYETLTGRLMTALGKGPQALQVWALRDVSFDVAPGECLGIMGPNGSGKSTLLSLVAGILEPTSGTVTARGRVGTLLKLGACAQPELSVRDNVELAGVLMGLRRAEALKRMDAVLHFAGLAPLADVRLGELSTGQAARMAFAAALHSDLDILLVDEALSVGDAEFQGRCAESFERLRAQGKTLLIVSHDEAALRRLSTRLLHLREGRVQAVEQPEAALA